MCALFEKHFHVTYTTSNIDKANVSFEPFLLLLHSSVKILSSPHFLDYLNVFIIQYTIHWSLLSIFSEYTRVAKLTDHSGD